ncbi:hypothetical protein DV738_g4851, partial [Chaetothyriales sp. CBS 135597]
MSRMEPLPLLTGTITLSEALDDEADVLRKLTYPEKRLDFYQFLHAHAREIEAIVSHHLGLSAGSCRTPWVSEWVHGSFNVCIPIYVNGIKRVVIRFPLPYKIGESSHPGNVEEKLRCEVATYVWMQSHCSSVPIPRLWGFHFPDGTSFTALRQAPFISQLSWYLQQSISWVFGWPAAASFVIHPHRQKLACGYMIVDYVGNGRMLSASWDAINGDVNKRQTLYRDISRIMLSLARVPFPRIGSLTMDNYGVVSLANRPLGLHLHELENDEIPTGIPRTLTYAATDSYLLDQLSCHDNRIRYQPNSILSQPDGQSQLSTLTIMRALLPHFMQKERRHGPFILMLTDLHPSNIFVAEDGHVTGIIDLEWACTLPVEMLQPPYWLTNRAIDQITGDSLVTYGQRLKEFIAVFQGEEGEVAACGSTASYAELMSNSWDSGGFWYFNAIDSLTGLYNLFLDHIQPNYGPEATKGWKDFERLVTPYWAIGTTKFIESKLEEREKYLKRLRTVFERANKAPVARFNTFEEDDETIKAQIGHASHTQRALRHQLGHPKPCHDHNHPSIHRHAKSVDHLTRQDSFWNASPDSSPLDRSLSFNSSSTFREPEAARQAQWRDSPISFCHLKQTKREQKLEKKAAKEREKVLKKIDKLALRVTRSSDAHVALFPSSAPGHGAQGPKRALSAPSSSKAKEAAIQLVKKLTTTKSKLPRKWSKKEHSVPTPHSNPHPPHTDKLLTKPPHIDEFLSKPDLQNYLNPMYGEETQEIAELPGPLPSYTPFQDTTKNDMNSPISDLEPVTVDPPIASPSSLDSPAVSRMMRCDHCQFGIKLDEQYFHCSICNSGDRIVCSACDAAGLSCRHELTERVRRVLRYDDGARQRNASRPPNRQTDLSSSDPPPQTRPSALLTDTQAGFHGTMSPPGPSLAELHDRHCCLELRELDLRRREQDVTLREREAVLAEREAQLRIHEAETDTRVQRQEADNQALMSQLIELASLGAQFVRSLSQKSSSSSDEKDILSSLDDSEEHLRQHAGKRKTSSGRSSSHVAGSPATPSVKSPLRKTLWRPESEGNEDGDEEGAGTPKRPRLGTEANGELLYACHFCKFDGQRYSERNTQEKHYRGCSSGYWPDVSRLKQHLYRVHWRGRHCNRCYKTFKRPEDMEEHRRESKPCTERECPFPEKFDDEKYNEIRRKRPSASPEEVWYVIYRILFPGQEPPASPYADGTSAEQAASDVSTPPSSAMQISNAAQAAFAARLDQSRQVAWLQEPGAREFLLEQLQESMNEVIRSMQPWALRTPSTAAPSVTPSPATPYWDRPVRVSVQVQHSDEQAVELSPCPTTAAREGLTPPNGPGDQFFSSGRRGSFSRPLSYAREGTCEPTLISGTETARSEISFRAPTPVDIDDRYDSDSGSWQHGDEKFGFAMTTSPGFEFEFSDAQMPGLEPAHMDTAPPSANAQGPKLMSAPVFKPVKIASLVVPQSSEAAVETSLRPTASDASGDSGYISAEQHPQLGRARIKGHRSLSPLDTRMPDSTPDHGVNMDALDVAFEEFLGLDTDEFGNVNVMPNDVKTVAAYAAGASLAAIAAFYVFGPTFFIDGDHAYTAHDGRKRTIVGLVNSANDCFINSVLQALAGLGDVRLYLIKELHRREIEDKEIYTLPPPVLRNGETVEKVVNLQSGLVTRALKEMLDALNERPIYKKTISARPLIIALEKAFRTRISRNQQDAHEFLQIVLERLCDEYHAAENARRRAREKALPDGEGDGRDGDVAVPTPHPDTGRVKTVAAVASDQGFPFEGRIESQIQCQHCGFKTKPTATTFVSLTLNVPQKSATSLDSCFDMLLKSEEIDDFKCDKCRLCQALEWKQKLLKSAKSDSERDQLASDIEKIEEAIRTDPEKPPDAVEMPDRSQAPKRKIRKSTRITVFPKIIAIHLSRSVFDPGSYSTKNMAKVSYTPRLRLGGLLNEKWYKLLGVVCHKGSHSSGHYESFRRNHLYPPFATPDTFAAYAAAYRPAAATTKATTNKSTATTATSIPQITMHSSPSVSRSDLRFDTGSTARRKKASDRWWRISDDKIKETRTSDVLSMQREVYLLFYDSKIVVEKLTKNVTEAHLSEIFGSYGRIESIDLPLNRQFMTNRGTAYILYDHPSGSESAIAHMHEAQLDGAVITVTLVFQIAFADSATQETGRRASTAQPAAQKTTLTQLLQLLQLQSEPQPVPVPVCQQKQIWRETLSIKRQTRFWV